MTTIRLVAAAAALAASAAFAQPAQVVDVPTRAGVTERALVIAPEAPKAVVVLLAGGGGRLQINDGGSIRFGRNFLVRSRELFAQPGNAVVVLDAPSDQSSGMNIAFRQGADHVADLAAVIAWSRAKWNKPVWLVGTSRGTQSVAYAAVALAGDAKGPDGIVLSSSILARSRFDGGTPVQELALDKLKIPVLVVHHQDDGCLSCAPSRVREIMAKLPPATSKLVMETGGVSTGDPCEAMAHHGYNGIEDRVVSDITAFITGH
jgi:hypothetical protein